VVIVRDMWQIRFDTPCLPTMYADQAMNGHAFMQAIARVNVSVTPSTYGMHKCDNAEL